MDDVPRAAPAAPGRRRQLPQLADAGDDHGHYEDLYGEIGGDIKPRGMGPSDHFRTSGLRILLTKDGTVTGLAYLRNNGGHYEDVYVKTPDGWRIKERKYFKP